MRVAPLALLALALTACTDAAETPHEQEANAPSAAATEPEGSGFAILRGADTVVTERYTRRDGRLEGELAEVGGRSRVQYTAEVGAGELPTRVDLRFFGPDTASGPVQAILEFRGDSVIAQEIRGGSADTSRAAVPAGISVHVNPSIALMEQLLRRARTLGGERVTLPVFRMGGGTDPEIVQAEVSWVGADSARIVVNGRNRVHLAVDGEGRILGGENPDEGVQIQRLR